MRFLAALMPFLIAALALATPARADCDDAAAYSVENKGVSLLVIDDGTIVCERYANGGGADKRWEIASGTKSFSGVMAAAAVADGLLTLDEPVSKTITEWQSDGRSSITIRQLLSLTSGLETPRPRLGKAPTYAEAVQLPLAHPPGTHFAYGPAPFQAFGEIMKRKLAKSGETPLAYLDRRVLRPAGVTGYEWRKDSDGNALLPQGAQLTARQWGAFGEWVRRGAPGIDAAAFAENFKGSKVNPAYGLTWWLAADASEGTSTDPTLARASDYQSDLSVFPGDMVLAAGAGDQRLFISRQERLVVVRQAKGIAAALVGNRGDFSDVEFWRLLMK